MKWLTEIQPLDTFIARDGRPFRATPGARMKSLKWLYPSVPVGSFRTMLGKMIDPAFSAETVRKLKSIRFAGPFPTANGSLFFPAPLDILINDADGNRNVYVLRPRNYPDGSGSDLPGEDILPVMISNPPDTDFKPAAGPMFWSGEIMLKWLMRPDGDDFVVPPDPQTISEEENGIDFLNTPVRDTRRHVKINPETRASEPHKLFSTTGLKLPENVRIALFVSMNAPVRDVFESAMNSLKKLHPMGGERRQALWTATQYTETDVLYPRDFQQRLANANGLRMVLATPAVFSSGWKPGWLDENNEGIIPGASDMKVRLRGVVNGRWTPLSGFNLDKHADISIGPKPVRRMVPAGSVYFFELTDPSQIDGAAMDALWLKSVCDDEQLRNDGFGLALWGLW